jgi:uncharacterized protein (TIGR03435 family)
MRRCAVTILACILLAATGLAAPNVGEPAPPITLKHLLQAPADADPSWEALRGKVVILEFWATWCAPCVAAIPHLNELAEHFHDQPVQFIAVTNEDEQTINRFLTRRPMSAWIGLDTDRSMLRAYGVTGIPHTVVVDQDGIIAAITHPRQLQKQHIQNLLDGMPAGLAAQEQVDRVFVPGTFPDEEIAVDAIDEPLLRIEIRPTSREHGGASSGGSGATMLGFSVKSIFASAFGFGGTRMIVEAPLPEGRYDVVMTVPWERRAAADRVLQGAVQAAFGVSAEREMREMDVYILTAVDGNFPGRSPTVMTDGISVSQLPGEFEAMNVTFASLSGPLQSAVGLPVVDETGSAERYDLRCTWDERSPDRAAAIIEAVRDQLGLEVTPARREIEVLILRSADDAIDR